MLYGIIISLIVLISILLILVILLQPGQREGLSGGLAAGMAGGSAMGARRTADLLSKTTSILAGALLVLCVLANFAIDKGEQASSAVQQSGLPEPVEQDFNLPSETTPAIPQNENEEEEEN
ncbi:MAG TPA: preprotein translocase subunit SecG [Balneolaceae bacterium]|nr:preprotein translocase subunit SecG [Balneolaceae bacterium]